MRADGRGGLPLDIAFAPMEGLTGAVYRQAHCRVFGGADRYFIPFITPTQDHRFTKRELREILPEHNRGLTAVPQLLVRKAEDFLWAAGELAAMGWPEVNLNLGCPSGTVVAKGKGSGFLGLPEELERFLDAVFEKPPCAISIKTRLGVKEPEEFGPLLALFRRYPLAELTVHPRVQKDMYKNTPRRDYFAAALADSPFPVRYNGDLYTLGELEQFQREFPAAGRVMLGRGLAGDPALARKAKGGPAATRDELRAFHDLVYEDYTRIFGSRRNAMLRMKEVWFYLIHLFGDNAKHGKAIKKARDTGEYESAVAAVFRELPLLPDLRAGW